MQMHSITLKKQNIIIIISLLLYLFIYAFCNRIPVLFALFLLTQDVTRVSIMQNENNLLFIIM